MALVVSETSGGAAAVWVALVVSEGLVEPAGLVALVTRKSVEPAGGAGGVGKPGGAGGIGGAGDAGKPVRPVSQESPVVRGDPAEPVQ